MQPEELYAARKDNWEALVRLLDRSQGGMDQLSPDDVRLLGQYYRSATADLAVAQRDFPRHRVTVYLNRLVARSHSVIYRGEPLALRKIWRFVVAGYPRAYRQAFPFILTAALLFFVPALLVGLLTYARPDTARWTLPAQIQDNVRQLQEQDLWTDIPVGERPYASSFIAQNNIRVSFLAFAGGVTGGLLTLYLMLVNGLILGGLSGVAWHYGVGFELWTFVIGHGVVELSVIFIAGGAGLMLGWSILRPGYLRRRDALAQAAVQAVRLVAGCIPLLLIAGTIEGFISPAEALPWPFKWATGLLTGLLLYTYLLFGGRKQEQNHG
jgi:uncharacterized membrane protein SpoIIM required for sporulation